MTNIEFNNAAVNMGYRYCGINNFGQYVWIKPIGNVCLKIDVYPNMENIHISSLCWVLKDNLEYSYDNDMLDNDIPDKVVVPAVYSSRNLKSMYSDANFDECGYDEFLEFITTAEYEVNIAGAMSCNPNIYKNFAFRCTDDVFTMIETTYDIN